MHIPDGFLSPGVAASTGLVAAGSLTLALRAERREPSPMPSGILGSVAAFLFAAQMINVPVAPGTSGHLVGAMLATALVGPWRGMLAMASVLAVQAFLFQDGGITAFGANFVDMGLAGCLVGYAAARFVGRRVEGPRGVVAGAVVGGFAATLCGAALVALWLAASGLYPLRGILPVMLVTHAGIGVLEAGMTGAILVTLMRWRPDLAGGIGSDAPGRSALAFGGGVFGVALLVAALLAPLASSLPDGVDHAARTLGFASRSRALWPAPMPGYAASWMPWARAAPAVSGLIGTVAVAILAWAISRTLARHDDASHR